VQGKSNQQIAEALVISIATVKAHISSILSKLGVSSRTEAIAYAIKHRLVTL
jgi:NarL family two-component system response regulator LiaR